jgi:hypothetical protein
MTTTADRPVGNDSTCVLNIYTSLLADVCELSKVPLGALDGLTYEWLLKEAPKLDKQLLRWIEGDGEYPSFPEWISPLSDEFRSLRDPKILRLLRQLLLFCYKIELEPTNDQLKEAQSLFEETDSIVGLWEDTYESRRLHLRPVIEKARSIIGRVIYRLDYSRIVPSHGPGAVFPPRMPSNKGDFRSIYTTIDKYFPFCDYFCGLPSYWEAAGGLSQDYTRHEEIISSLVAVPKDSRGPRLICVHPSESIWIQQGCRKILEKAITAPNSPCHGYINFHDQSVNGSLALSSSLTQEYVTLDLKEASDRISCKLVEELFGSYSYSYLSCSRASKVKLLDNRVIKLRKWAPMGNALTFPVQSLSFYAIVRAGICVQYGIDCPDVYVFGDDILYPPKFHDGVLSVLVRLGLVPNQNKTFRRGLFRESCGVDAYSGVDVTPHRMKRIDFSSVSGAESNCTLAKALAQSGFHRTSESIYREVSKHRTLHLCNNPNAQGLYRYINCDLGSLMQMDTPIRFNRFLHRWEVPITLVRGVNQHISTDAWWHLQESLLKLESMTQESFVTGGLRYAVPHRTRSQRGWTEVV